MAANRMEPPAHPYGPPHHEGVKGHQAADHAAPHAVDQEISSAFRKALDVLTARGASLVNIELPNAGAAIPVYYLVATAEASSNLARYDGVRFGLRVKGADDDLISMYGRTRAQGFGPEVKRRIMLGTYVLSAGYYDAYYLKAQQVRTLIRRDYEQEWPQDSGSAAKKDGKKQP